jgi:hypothetical protein
MLPRPFALLREFPIMDIIYPVILWLAAALLVYYALNPHVRGGRR